MENLYLINAIQIAIMVLGGAILGYLLRYFWEKVYSQDNYDHIRDFEYDHIIAEEDNLNDITSEKEVIETNEKEDLKNIEGIGPKIEELLNKHGILNYHDLANSSVEELLGFLKEGGERFKLHDPSTWPAQAELAYHKKWDELKEYQDFLSGGKELK